MNCPLCKNTTYQEWGKVGTYSILRCRKCGLGITSPLPDEEERRLLNTEIYRLEERIHAYLSRRSYFEKRYRENIATIKRFKQNGTLLDVGCNIGLFLTVAREEGFSVIGVELNKGCADYGRNAFNLDIRTDVLDNVSIPEQSIDVITLFDVLEHVPDMHGFMLSVKRLLKKDGLLVLQSPNFQSLMVRLTGTNWNWLTPPDHVYHFTPTTIEMLLKEHRLDIKMLRTWEPATEFSNNVFTSIGKSHRYLGNALLLLNNLTKFATAVVLVIQRMWWRKRKGGLIELYAVNKEE